jgi:hypothetical protein
VYRVAGGGRHQRASKGIPHTEEDTPTYVLHARIRHVPAYVLDVLDVLDALKHDPVLDALTHHPLPPVKHDAGAVKEPG